MPEAIMRRVGRFRFEQIEHTADKAIIAHGATFELMLESAAAGMFAQQVELSTVARERRWTIVAEGDSAEDLLIAWLRELLILSEREEVVLCDFKITSYAPWKLEAKVWGGGYGEKVRRTGAGVKAITYHNLAVAHTRDWQGSVTFDV
jgi:SHS2 domain-containing protein